MFKKISSRLTRESAPCLKFTYFPTQNLGEDFIFVINFYSNIYVCLFRQLARDY